MAPGPPCSVPNGAGRASAPHLAPITWHSSVLQPNVMRVPQALKSALGGPVQILRDSTQENAPYTTLVFRHHLWKHWKQTNNFLLKKLKPQLSSPVKTVICKNALSSPFLLCCVCDGALAQDAPRLCSPFPELLKNHLEVGLGKELWWVGAGAHRPRPVVLWFTIQHRRDSPKKQALVSLCLPTLSKLKSSDKCALQGSKQQVQMTLQIMLFLLPDTIKTPYLTQLIPKIAAHTQWNCQGSDSTSEIKHVWNGKTEIARQHWHWGKYCNSNAGYSRLLDVAQYNMVFLLLGVMAIQSAHPVHFKGNICTPQSASPRNLSSSSYSKYY